MVFSPILATKRPRELRCGNFLVEHTARPTTIEAIPTLHTMSLLPKYHNMINSPLIGNGLGNCQKIQ
jgi:hypothetical protein